MYSICPSEEQNLKCQSWVQRIMEKGEKHSSGSYLGDADFQVRAPQYWFRAAGQKLTEVRKKWNPTGRICGYLDWGDKSGIDGLKNVNEWET